MAQQRHQGDTGRTEQQTVSEDGRDAQVRGGSRNSDRSEPLTKEHDPIPCVAPT